VTTAGAAPVIAVGEISHESNSFSAAKTPLADFHWPPDASAEAALRAEETASTVLSGYLEGSRRFEWTLRPTVLARATPRGPVTEEAFETLAAALIARLGALPRLDGVLLSHHGAMVTERYASGDTEIVRRVREAVGARTPIVVTLDFHANVTPEIVRGTTVLLTYKENPHVDTRERGLQAAQIMHRIVTGRVRPVQAVVKPPMVYNIIYQHTRREPLRPIVEASRRLEQDARTLAASVSGGYQYADVPEMGPSVVVAADGDAGFAEREARRLADMMWAARETMTRRLPDAADAVRQARDSAAAPVALMDLGDNVGGGSAGDSTFLLAELVRQNAAGWLVTLADPEAVERAARAGIGGRFDGWVGGKSDTMHGRPVRVQGRVSALHDGLYVEPEVRHGGERYFDMGLTARVTVDGSAADLPNVVLLTSRRSSPNSLGQLTSCGVHPERQRILIVKGAIAPRAAYEPVAARIIEVDTPGATAVNPGRFTYVRVRRPLWGLDAAGGPMPAPGTGSSCRA
jgi:microcystin degradation protein MlrC